jgi:hypothetical protein
VTNTFPRTQLTLIYSLVAASYILIVEGTMAHCQTIQSVAETNDYSMQLDSPIANTSALDIKQPLNIRQRSKKEPENLSIYGNSYPNPFRPNSKKQLESGVMGKFSKIPLKKTGKAISTKIASLESEKHSSESEQLNTDLTLAQPISMLPAKPILDSNVRWDFEMQDVMPAKPTLNVTWDFELLSESNERSLSLTKSPTHPAPQIQAVTHIKTRLIYQPAVPTVDKHGRMILKPKVMLSSGEVISGYNPQ